MIKHFLPTASNKIYKALHLDPERDVDFARVYVAELVCRLLHEIRHDWLSQQQSRDILSLRGKIAGKGQKQLEQSSQNVPPTTSEFVSMVGL